uniref:Uncharacterized protein n=1 Tax=Rhizophora mucronata TaxID=61149 RepID=A0A2P2NCA3_RHIMU
MMPLPKKKTKNAQAVTRVCL